MTPPIHDREQAMEAIERVLRDAGPYPFRYKAWAERIVEILGIGQCVLTNQRIAAELRQKMAEGDHAFFIDMHVARCEAEERAERAEERLRAATDVLRYLADTENWLGNPHDQQATLHGHFTPYELARAVLTAVGSALKPPRGPLRGSP